MGILMRGMTESSAEINGHIDAIATEIQFQDSNRKRMQDVIQTLQLLADATREVQAASGAGATPDQEIIQRILDACGMDEVRHRFAAWLQTGAATSDAPAGNKTIELF
jgi:hypothetical protein